MNTANYSSSEKLVRKDCNNFLKTKKGFHYLMMKYPHLSILQAIDEYIKTALKINSLYNNFLKTNAI